ncbi:MAG TPA: hypothetical protein VJM07_01885 [Gaiella sp.]|nr:hypothetical protein [Gaiella sp.]
MPAGGAYAFDDERAKEGDAVPLHRGGLPPLESIDGARIHAAAVEYEIEVVGPLPDA